MNLMNYLFKSAATFLVILLFAQSSFAIDPDDPKDTTKEGREAQVIAFEDSDAGIKNNLIMAWDGWNDYYRGYEKSPILLDPTELKRKYPELADRPGVHIKGKGETPMHNGAPEDVADADKERASLKALNLGVNDEVLKTTMAIYQPLRLLQNDMANDEVARDDYLNLFKSLRGVANLTLSYLDKTVSSGLATTQQQLDENASNHISKQISWTSSRIANPQRSAVYIDTDQKIEACLSDGVVEVDGGPDDKRNIRMALKDCEKVEACGKRPATKDKLGEGLYSWCVCCAEMTAHMNDTLPVKDKDIGAKTYSLVAKAFYGTKGVETGNPTKDYNHKDEIKVFVKDVVGAFREMYGDVQIKGDGKKLTYEYVYPNLSPALKTKFFREGCTAVADNNPGCEECTLACPLTQTKVTMGICPAMVEILRNWPQTAKDAVGGDANKKRIARNKWINASFGKVVSARDIDNMFELIDQPATGEKWFDGPMPPGKLGRWLDAFCDASAVSGFKRFHVRMKSVTLDHITQNFHITAQEKGMLMNLMGRVDEYLALTEVDVNSGYVSESALTGIAIAADRKKQARQAAGMAATINHSNAATQTSGFQVWGQSGTTFCEDGNCGE